MINAENPQKPQFNKKEDEMEDLEREGGIRGERL
jgi:hypothetical protein